MYMCAFADHLKLSQGCNQLCRSVSKLCLTLCDPMDCSTPGFPVFHCLLEFSILIYKIKIKKKKKKPSHSM